MLQKDICELHSSHKLIIYKIVALANRAPPQWRKTAVNHLPWKKNYPE